jgi:hypothetical protein
VPFVSAFAGTLPGVGCEHAGMVHSWHPDDRSDEGVRGGSGSSHQHAVDHQCKCVHAVPSVSVVDHFHPAAPVVPKAEAIAGQLSGPAYPAPLYVFLRPPD